MAAVLASAPDYVAIGDRAAVAAKVARLCRADVGDLHVIADFDYTLTRFRLEDGARSASTHTCIETFEGLSEEYRAASRRLLEHYYPIEVSDIPFEEKRAAMVEWWSQVRRADGCRGWGGAGGRAEGGREGVGEGGREEGKE